MLSKIIRKITRTILPFFLNFPIIKEDKLIEIGEGYGSWFIKDGILNDKSVCYCVGAGTNIDFDIFLTKKYGCDVFIFDPTPKSILFFNQIKDKEQNTEWFKKIRFTPVGIWGSDVIQKFFLPQNKEYVSASILNLEKTSNFFEAECKKVSSIMRENNHTKIDLLKLDIEGAEYSVLLNLLEEKILPKILCVEFDEIHSPSGFGAIFRIRKIIGNLLNNNYKLIHVDNKSDYTFLMK